MTPLPTGGGPLTAWRLDREKYASEWQSGEGAFQAGGRWNPQGMRTIYASLDPSTAILEVAVHKGLKVLDMQPHILTRFEVLTPPATFRPEDLPDPDWLRPDGQTPDQRNWGAEQLTRHGVLALPSAVSRFSWNLILKAPPEPDRLGAVEQSRFVLDARLAGA